MVLIFQYLIKRRTIFLRHPVYIYCFSLRFDSNGFFISFLFMRVRAGSCRGANNVSGGASRREVGGRTDGGPGAKPPENFLGPRPSDGQRPF